MLAGEIPRTIGSCESLEYLNIDSNFFQGSIPTSLSNLKAIQELDLSRNNFTGKIPEYFKSFQLLQYLNLSYNDFDGMVPIKGVFRNASAISIMGNSKLCGGIPELQLPRCNLMDPKKRGSTTLSFKMKETRKTFYRRFRRLVFKSVLPKHRNLVKILSACSSVDFQNNDFKALVYEFMVNGSLDDRLHPIGGQVHCDLKPSNVLLDDDMTAHVGDYGISRFLLDANQNISENQTSSLQRRYIIEPTPLHLFLHGVVWNVEYGIGSGVSTSGDVYSYGILLLQMFLGKRPTDEMFNDGMNLHNYAKMVLPQSIVNIAYSILFQQEEEGENF
ncbi:probable LRR receptor-like serine/threonine-protein kinase At3g47570 [Cornus florida]|uniref:probable LRR receptor-like serine/threonine-protein kinase At3g47570 n=1 Tax=Cornus florida TaxID=4283 RepID=UPI00289A84B8|nr:probable LRR receptor-like serine/threonine-protein kinase At3g47570 [Cornus florida]